ncbi:FAD-dependent oxidoreductase [Henriciella mobilis]|uniref:NAD(P)/FAD-dependent oxidoreductase n=1 Tax=Henriciella mobilis TaxID=2305467 RepID=UPI000E670662|nr:FAD-dependent oxidoreductase [Henriciella mobilis]RIJ16851.1 FAD-dependent oxidoreductase [Henriciella mobilis]RIJ19368.1 FAD-dependent oxidoreductase [Henriciella mobilis]
MREDVLVIGAGIGGLCAALSLAPTGRQITLLERDQPPPSDDPDVTFLDWHRQGAGHVRQSHAFLARLRSIIKQSHPRLLDELLSMGARELTFDMMLTELQQETYEPAPEDAELTIITSRRTTLELTMRRYVESLENVTIRPGFFVRDLMIRKAEDGVVEVLGVRGEEGGVMCELAAEIVVDASGKSGFTIQQLMDEGAPITEESETAGILYFTRHYRLLPGMEEPSRTENPPGSGDLGYLKFGVFPGDNGCFSITIAVPEVEIELRKAILNPDTFHAITLELPGLEPWTNDRRSKPRGKVYGMGDLHSRWRYMVNDSKPATRNYFPLGDTLVRTNPLYGRGCSFAAVSAEALRASLAGSTDPDEQQIAYHAALQEELRPYYTNQRRQDRSAIKRARNALTPGYRAGWKARMMESFFEDGVRIAIRSDVGLLRQAMRGFHMLEHPDKWLGKPGNLMKVLYYWSRGKKRNAAAYPPNPGPARDEMLRSLAIDEQADISRLADHAAVAA